MTEGKNIQSWVQKAVADVAAFGGFSLRRVDTKAERMAIGALLANANLTEDDREYIEGFMLDRSAKSEKIDGERPRRNKERSVEIPAGPLYGDSFDELTKLAESREKLKLFFDKNGKVIKEEVRGKDGESYVLKNIDYMDNDEAISTMEAKYSNGMICTTRTKISKSHEPTTLDMVVKANGETIHEMHTEEDGTVVDRKYPHVAAQNQYATGFDNINWIGLPEVESIQRFVSKVQVFEETYKDGVVTGKFIDADGKVIGTVEGTYKKDNFGNLRPQYDKSPLELMKSVISEAKNEVMKEFIRKEIPSIIENREKYKDIIEGLEAEQTTVMTYEEAVNKLMNEQGLSKEEAEKKLAEAAGKGSTPNVPEIAPKSRAIRYHVGTKESSKVETFNSEQERKAYIQERSAIDSNAKTNYEQDARKFDKDVKEKEE